jgi:hypothetical protein
MKLALIYTIYISIVLGLPSYYSINDQDNIDTLEVDNIKLENELELDHHSNHNPNSYYNPINGYNPLNIYNNPLHNGNNLKLSLNL